MHAILQRVLTYHWLLTLVVMGAAALVVGIISLNLFVILRANIDLIAEHGTMALVDGAFLQLVRLVGLGYLSVVAYVVFKACERNLVDRLLR